jgi:hypothetical protein
MGSERKKTPSGSGSTVFGSGKKALRFRDEGLWDILAMVLDEVFSKRRNRDVGELADIDKRGGQLRIRRGSR